MEALKVENLHKYFELNRKFAVQAVNGVSFIIRKNETLGLVGESGSGKTTVGRSITRLIEPTSGDIYLEGKNITYLSLKAFRKLRSRIQIVFQDPYDSLNPRIVVKDLIEDPLIVQGKFTK